MGEGVTTKIYGGSGNDTIGFTGQYGAGGFGSVGHGDSGNDHLHVDDMTGGTGADTFVPSMLSLQTPIRSGPMPELSCGTSTTRKPITCSLKPMATRPPLPILVIFGRFQYRGRLQL